MNFIHILILTLSVTFLFLTSSSSSAATCDKKDKKALVDFKKHFPRSYTSNWNSHSDCCDWSGVDCDPKTGRVTSLIFMGDPDSDNIPVDQGTVPPSVGYLTALNSVVISDIPNLVGPLPSTMANLKNIQSFAIFNTSISGPLPNMFDGWTSLTDFEINECGKLTGPVPSSLGSLSKLATITLDHNQFTC